MIEAEFKWGQLSCRQQKMLCWWHDDSPFRDYNGIIADGAIRSGKTVSMGFSFALWAMTRFNGYNFGMCGKTIEALRRNVITTLKRQLRQRGYNCRENKAENLIIITHGNRENRFYLFGGKDERSQDLIQGITLAGCFFDEVALMPESFVNQATARCSVDGSKFWFNCNPGSPQHWFYTGWVLRCKERKMVYLHFTMKDNLTLTKSIRERYEAQYSGVFYKRYISGLWVMAEGLVYDMFSKERHVLDTLPKTESDCYVSSDFGIQNATVFILWKKQQGADKWIAVREWYYSGREQKVQKTVSQLADGLQMMLGGEQPHAVIIDPSASALIAEVRKRGYKTRSADNDVLDGITDVSTMLMQDRLAFSHTCTGTIDEFGVYSWDAKAVERGEDKPVKDHDHAMDAVRYFVRTLRLAQPKAAYKSIFG